MVHAHAHVDMHRWRYYGARYTRERGQERAGGARARCLSAAETHECTLDA